MLFMPTTIEGVMVVQSEALSDARGHFARVFCAEEFASAGLEPTNVQMAMSHNFEKSTLRGLHFIPESEGEAKLVRCIAGTLFDVAVDFRPLSPTFGTWTSVELSAGDLCALYIPRGCGHGFMTLSPNTDVLYQFSEFHRPGVEKGIRWDDPGLAITWPTAPAVMSERDRALPLMSQVFWA